MATVPNRGFGRGPYGRWLFGRTQPGKVTFRMRVRRALTFTAKAEKS